MNIIAGLSIAETVIKTVEIVGSKLAPGMKAFAERMCALSEKYPSLEKFASFIDKAADIVSDVLFVLGVVSDPSSELGLKIEKADKSAEDFDSTEDYIQYLHDEIELDKDKVENLSSEEKIGYSISGIAVQAAALGEKVGMTISPTFMEFVAKMKDVFGTIIDAKKLISILISSNEDGLKQSNDIVDYFTGTGTSDRIKTGSICEDVFKNEFGEQGDELISDIKTEARKDQ